MASANYMDHMCEYMIQVPTTECQSMGDIIMVRVSASNMLGPGQSSGPISLGQCWHCMCVSVYVKLFVGSCLATKAFVGSLPATGRGWVIIK